MGYVSARTIATAVALTLFACGSPASAEGDAGEVYQARFALSGFLLQGRICVPEQADC